MTRRGLGKTGERRGNQRVGWRERSWNMGAHPKKC